MCHSPKKASVTTHRSPNRILAFPLLLYHGSLTENLLLPWNALLAFHPLTSTGLWPSLGWMSSSKIYFLINITFSKSRWSVILCCVSEKEWRILPSPIPLPLCCWGWSPQGNYMILLKANNLVELNFKLLVLKCNSIFHLLQITVHQNLVAEKEKGYEMI